VEALLLRRRLLISSAALLVAAGSLAACGDDDTGATATPSATEQAAAAATESQAQASFAELAKTAIPEIEGGAVLLDVRTQEEWDEGHAAPATLLPLSDIEGGKLPEASKDAKIFVTCRSGNRAGIAAEILRKAGYTHVTNIGGLTDWEAAGGEVTS
jgi:rhodanese-related sulfurtransferase